MALLQQMVGKMRPDESRSSGDQDLLLHGRVSNPLLLP
jgi:hypothetical protein